MLIKKAAAVKLKIVLIDDHWLECIIMIRCRGVHKNRNGQNFFSVPNVFRGLEDSLEDAI